MIIMICFDLNVKDELKFKNVLLVIFGDHLYSNLTKVEFAFTTLGRFSPRYNTYKSSIFRLINVRTTQLHHQMSFFIKTQKLHE